MRYTLISLALLAAALAWAAEPQPSVKSAGELAWEAIPDTIPDDQQVQTARQFLDQYPDDIPLLRSVQNVLNRKSDLTLDFWKERMDANPSSANRYLYARKSGDAQIMREQARLIMRRDRGNFWGYYLAAVAELSKDKPDLKVVTDYFEKAIAKDPSRPEGWGYAAQAYEELKDWDNALRMYEAAMVVDPSDKHPKMAILGIYAQQKDADKYFALVAELLPKEPPLDISLERYNSDVLLTTNDLKTDYTVLEVFAYWCGPCVRVALPEMNKLAEAGTLPFPFYPVHAEGKNEGGLALMDSNDVTGREWHLNFVFGDQPLNERLSVVAYPSFYVIDNEARPVAILVGHSESTIDILEWLIIEAKKRT